MEEPGEELPLLLLHCGGRSSRQKTPTPLGDTSPAGRVVELKIKCVKAQSESLNPRAVSSSCACAFFWRLRAVACCGGSALTKKEKEEEKREKKKPHSVVGSGRRRPCGALRCVAVRCAALSPALRARSALNEWERRAQCLLHKPTPIGH